MYLYLAIVKNNCLCLTAVFGTLNAISPCSKIQPLMRLLSSAVACINPLNALSDNFFPPTMKYNKQVFCQTKKRCPVLKVKIVVSNASGVSLSLKVGSPEVFMGPSINILGVPNIGLHLIWSKSYEHMGAGREGCVHFIIAFLLILFFWTYGVDCVKWTAHYVNAMQRRQTPRKWSWPYNSLLNTQRKQSWRQVIHFYYLAKVLLFNKNKILFC